MVKRIIREDEKKDQEETQDCQRSIPSDLDLGHSEEPSEKNSKSQTLETLVSF